MVKKRVVPVLGAALALAMCVGLSGSIAMERCTDGGCPVDDEFTTEFPLGCRDCYFTPWGKNPYFSLKPGYQLLLRGKEDGETIQVLITVLDQTKVIRFRDDSGRRRWVRTRVVEEREWVDCDLVEVSRNYFARCKQTNAIYYFGEKVDICEDGLVPDPSGYGFLCNGGEPSHDGAWRAGRHGAKPGLIMPGTFLLGSRYYQECAPDVAFDRAEHVEMGLTVQTEAREREFLNCVRVLETTYLDPEEESEKIYCPRVGLVIDDVVELVDYGYRLDDWWPSPDDPDCDDDDGDDDGDDDE